MTSQIMRLVEQVESEKKGTVRGKVSAFGRISKDCRNRNRLTQAKMADLLGFGAPFLSRVESGKTHPTRSLLQKYLSVFGGTKEERDLINKMIEEEEARPHTSTILNIKHLPQHQKDMLAGLVEDLQLMDPEEIDFIQECITIAREGREERQRKIKQHSN